MAKNECEIMYTIEFYTFLINSLSIGYLILFLFISKHLRYFENKIQIANRKSLAISFRFFQNAVLLDVNSNLEGEVALVTYDGITLDDLGWEINVFESILRKKSHLNLVILNDITTTE
jgi:hypothetical protein